MDSELDNFMKRFGTPNTLDSITETTPLTGQAKLSKQQGISLNDRVADSADNKSGLVNGASAAVGAAGGLLDAAPGVMEFISNAKGGQFDTSAEGGGVGKAGGAIFQGAASGMQAGQALGKMAGPMGEAIGAGVGLVAGGLNSTFAHSRAVKEYVDN